MLVCYTLENALAMLFVACLNTMMNNAKMLYAMPKNARSQMPEKEKL
jgi:hypothetical protein